MKLSVIIVNYNVKYFLEQVLLSVQKAAEGLAVEVIVVDNNSVDGSVTMVQEKFPQVIVIANQKNTGFSTANNQGIDIAKGQYVLLLNPDTVVEEDTFRTTVQFMDEHPEAGALGVKMYDGKGIFLPESKRGLPDLANAFYKMSGLSSLFPASKRFNYYYLGHLDANETQEIEVLSGAFMLMRKTVIDKIGGLDETFFMYGEDIDLSYRILQAGYKNYYYPHTRIIHYKGESTKKGSLNYVKVFYQAMIIFAQKHFSGDKAKWYILGIQFAIYIKAFTTIIARFFRQITFPLLDAATIYLGMYLIKDFWQNNVKVIERTIYAPEYMLINVPLYILIWLLSLSFNGGYDRPFKIAKSVRGILLGTLVIAAVYGFLPESLRFSRGMIILGMAWSIFATAGLRIGVHFWQNKSLTLEKETNQRIILVGSLSESKRVKTLLHEVNIPIDIIGSVAPPDMVSYNKEQFLGQFHQLQEIVTIYNINEIIFCGKDIASQAIIQSMINIGQQIDYKIVPADSLSIIGSNSKNTAGDLYTIDVTINLNKSQYQKSKRWVDISVCLLTLLLLPLIGWKIKPFKQFCSNWWKVLWNQATWVGYATMKNQAKNGINLPALQQGILSPLSSFKKQAYDEPTIYRLNLLYAKDYTAETDWLIIWKGWKKLGMMAS